MTDDYEGTRFSVRRDGVRMLTPFALVVLVLLSTDVVFAVDSVPAVYGITGDPYLVFATNAFALLGLRALYFLLEGALSKLVHLSYGLSFILAFIGVKLLLHWGHGIWTWLPEIPTLLSLVVIVGALVVVTITSLLASRRAEAAALRAQEHRPDGRRAGRRPRGGRRPRLTPPGRTGAPSPAGGGALGRPGCCGAVVLWCGGAAVLVRVAQPPFAALKASMTSALMRPRSETWCPLARAHSRIVVESEPTEVRLAGARPPLPALRRWPPTRRPWPTHSASESRSRAAFSEARSIS